MRLYAKILAIAFLCAALWINTGIIYNCLLYVPDQYDCEHMSHDQAEFFNSLGFTVYQKNGHYDDDRMGHSWIEIDFLGIRIPWESTYLIPLSPTWTHHYDQIEEKKIE